MELNEYKISFEPLDLLNSTVSGIMKVYHNNSYISIFCSIIVKDDISNLYVNFSKCPTQRHNNDDILISRAIDKSIRPLISGANKSVSIQITLLQGAKWADIKCWSIMCALYMLREVFDIKMGVASIAIGGKYFEKNNNMGYVLVCGNEKEIVFMEMEGAAICNIKDVLVDLLHQAQEVANLVIKVIPKNTLKFPSLTPYSRTGRLPLQHRAFNVVPNTSNNSLILSRGDTTILSIFNVNSKSTEFEFEHIYKSSGFATNETHSKSSRREVGHANLVQKALYSKVSSNVILRRMSSRAVSYVLNANGSTSMASVTAVCLNMLKEGFIMQNELLYGISFGAVINQKGSFQVICDLTAHEDNMSINDFKIVADSTANVYAIQMDAKIPLPSELVYKILGVCKSKFAEISTEINTLITEKNIQQNIKRVISEDLSKYLKQYNIIEQLKRVITRCYWDNKLYIHLQNTSSTLLQEIANFYLASNLIPGSTICVVITEDMEQTTTLKNWHNIRFTRKQSFKKNDIIRCKVNTASISLIEVISSSL